MKNCFLILICLLAIGCWITPTPTPIKMPPFFVLGDYVKIKDASENSIKGYIIDYYYSSADNCWRYTVMFPNHNIKYYEKDIILIHSSCFRKNDIETLDGKN